MKNAILLTNLPPSRTDILNLVCGHLGLFVELLDGARLEYVHCSAEDDAISKTLMHVIYG
jgi:hypothetical protein